MLLSTLSIPLAILAAPVMAASIYLLGITVAAWWRCHPRSTPSAPYHPRVLCIIPAHNEAGNISTTVRSILAAETEARQPHMTVIADNCTDTTAAEARSAGACVVERAVPDRHGKGQALDWFLRGRTDLLQQHDLVAIIDADSTVSPGFFSAMAAPFTSPAVLAAQAFYDVANPFAGWRTMLLSAALRALHHTRPAGRTRLGGSAGLRGNGMMFRSSLLLEHGWPAGSVVEDLEFSIMLAFKGIPVHFVPLATVHGDMPHSHAAASSQRLRWEGGRWQMVRAWLPAALRHALRTPSPLSLDTLLDLATPPLSALVLLQLAYTILAGLLAPPQLPLAIGMLAATAAHVATGLLQTRAPLKLWLALAAVPLFICWKLGIYATLAGKRNLDWIRSSREGGPS